MPAEVFIKGAGEGMHSGLKTGLALAALTGRPVEFRGLMGDGSRPGPGLGPGVITAAAAACAATGGRFRGDPGDTELRFEPGGQAQPRAGEYSFDVARQGPSAAPLSMVLETMALPLAAAGEESQLLLQGGTHVLGGVTSDEVNQVLAPNWRAAGLKVEYTEITPGFFPQATGEAEARIYPAMPLAAVNEEGAFTPRLVGVVVTQCGLPVHLAEQALEGALARLEVHGLKAKGRIRRVSGAGRGMALLVWAQGDRLRCGFSLMGQRGGRPGALATRVVEALVSFLQSGASLPSHLAASLVPVLACAGGVSRLSVDRPSKSLNGALNGVDAFFPGCLRLDPGGPGQPLGIKIIGQGIC